MTSLEEGWSNMNWIQGDLVKKQQVKQPHPNHTDVDVWPSMFVTPQRVELSGNYEDIVPKRCVWGGGNPMYSGTRALLKCVVCWRKGSSPWANTSLLCKPLSLATFPTTTKLRPAWQAWGCHKLPRLMGNKVVNARLSQGALHTLSEDKVYFKFNGQNC